MFSMKFNLKQIKNTISLSVMENIARHLFIDVFRVSNPHWVCVGTTLRAIFKRRLVHNSETYRLVDDLVLTYVSVLTEFIYQVRIFPPLFIVHAVARLCGLNESTFGNNPIFAHHLCDLYFVCYFHGAIKNIIM